MAPFLFMLYAALTRISRFLHSHIQHTSRSKFGTDLPHLQLREGKLPIAYQIKSVFLRAVQDRHFQHAAHERFKQHFAIGIF